jgi:hypothetical protein
MGVVPLFTSVNHGPEYLTLKEALEKEFLTVTEVSHGGSVPELKVGNRADIAVLLLDGEELVGAKQNRVLNTSILLKQKSETVIPVSCTEQGRWSYVSDRFADSGTIMSPRLRRKKTSSVTRALRTSRRYSSDQKAIWDEIHTFSSDASVRSPTGAMRDVFESRMDDLEQYLKAFTYVPHQRGLLAVINGEVVGLDTLSSESAYEILHPKLVKSYAMDALLQRTQATERPRLDKAKSFIEETVGCEEKTYDSIGHGQDFRFEGKTIAGAALIYQGKVIHIAFFRTPQSEASAA